MHTVSRSVSVGLSCHVLTVIVLSLSLPFPPSLPTTSHGMMADGSVGSCSSGIGFSTASLGNATFLRRCWIFSAIFDIYVWDVYRSDLSIKR